MMRIVLHGFAARCGESACYVGPRLSKFQLQLKWGTRRTRSDKKRNHKQNQEFFSHADFLIKVLGVPLWQWSLL